MHPNVFNFYNKYKRSADNSCIVFDTVAKNMNTGSSRVMTETNYGNWWDPVTSKNFRKTWAIISFFSALRTVRNGNTCSLSLSCTHAHAHACAHTHRQQTSTICVSCTVSKKFHKEWNHNVWRNDLMGNMWLLEQKTQNMIHELINKLESICVAVHRNDVSVVLGQRLSGWLNNIQCMGEEDTEDLTNRER